LSDNVRHSSETTEHYTPDYIVNPARFTLGHFDLDPAGSDNYAHTIGARNHYTQEQDGLKQPWYGNVWLNPPGGYSPKGTSCTRSSSALWWHVLSLHYLAGNIKAAFFLGFSLEQLQTIQKVKGMCLHPLNFPTIFFHTRIPFLDENLLPQDQPSHSNFLTLLPPKDDSLRDCIDAFTLNFEGMGEFVNV